MKLASKLMALEAGHVAYNHNWDCHNGRYFARMIPDSQHPTLARLSYTVICCMCDPPADADREQEKKQP